jgi:hypothetical protein
MDSVNDLLFGIAGIFMFGVVILSSLGAPFSTACQFGIVLVPVVWIVVSGCLFLAKEFEARTQGGN